MMGARARANRREKQRLSLQVARAELVLLMDGKVEPYLLELDLHKTWNVVNCVKKNGYLPYWAQPPWRYAPESETQKLIDAGILTP